MGSISNEQKYNVGIKRTIRVNISKEMDTHNKLEQNKMNGQNTGKCEETEKHMNLTGYKISHQDDNLAIILWNTTRNLFIEGA